MGSLYVGTQLVCPVAGNSSAVTEALNVTPSTSAQTIYPTSGLDGFAPVNVSAVTNNIDNNITAGNIKHGVSILGVTGNYYGDQSGTLSITTNGEHDVTGYATANVNVVTPLPDYMPWRDKSGGVYISDHSQTYFTTGNATSIGHYILAGDFCGSHLTTADLGKVVEVRDYGLFSTFRGCNYLTTIDVSKIATVKYSGMEGCFASCDLITSFSMPALTTVQTRGMAHCLSNCDALVNAYFDNVTTVGNEGFALTFSGDDALKNVSFGSLTDTGDSLTFLNTFLECTGITTFTGFMNLEIVGDNGMWGTFQGCENMISCNLANVQTVKTSGLQDCFKDCEHLNPMVFSSLETIYPHGFEECFKNCVRLRYLEFPALKTVDSTSFHDMLLGCSIVEVHFPSNLQSTMSSWSDVLTGFSGTHTSIVFDLPATNS